VQSRQLTSAAKSRAAGTSVGSHDRVHRCVRTEEDVRMSVAQRRVDVLGRLLDLGISPATLCLLLPEFAPLIRRLAAGR
jgi:hypothetical protein